MTKRIKCSLCHEKVLFLFIEITKCSFLKYLAKTGITIPSRKWTTNYCYHFSDSAAWGRRYSITSPAFAYPYGREGILAFRMPCIGKWYSCHITSLEVCIALNCCRYTVFKIWINHKTRTLFRLSTAIRCICQPFWAFLQPKMTDFPGAALWCTSTNGFPALSHAWSLEKVYLSGGASHIGHYREYPLRAPMADRIFEHLKNGIIAHF